MVLNKPFITLTACDTDAYNSPLAREKEITTIKYYIYMHIIILKAFLYIIFEFCNLISLTHSLP